MGNKRPKQKEHQSLHVKSVGEISHHSKVILEAGKLLTIESISTAREFCKDMIPVCTGAIPIYLGILVFVLPEHYTLGLPYGVLIAAPAILFLSSSLIFIIGYLPTKEKFSLNIIEDIERARTKTINRRNNIIKFGLTLYTVAMLLGIVVIILSIGSR